MNPENSPLKVVNETPYIFQGTPSLIVDINHSFFKEGAECSGIVSAIIPEVVPGSEGEHKCWSSPCSICSRKVFFNVPTILQELSDRRMQK